MYKIAVFVDNLGEVTTFDTQGHLRVFSKSQGSWQVIRDLIILPIASTEIHEIRDKFKAISSEISDCNVFVAKKISGVAYNILSSSKIVVWECEGRPEDFLDDIVDEEEKLKKDKEASKSIEVIIEEHIKKIREGHYYISLDDIQNRNEKLSSKQIIIPFLENKIYEKLDISCSHIPPWLESKSKSYGFSMKIEDECTNQLKISLIKE